MEIVSDLHIHGKYSRATSTQLDCANLEKHARIKGINLLGTGDFTHAKWIEEIRSNLEEDDEGILWSKSKFPFIWQTEISLVYTQDGKGRRVHVVTLAPNYDVVRQITEYLESKGRIDYDGRPIFKIPCPEYVDSLKSISKDIEIIPAHVWTPWFGLLGSMSGFDSVEEGFQDRAKDIHAIETGLSSDPEMNWRLKSLDKYALVSFSDLHSFWPWRIGREATIFDIDLSYKNLIKAIRTKEGLKETIEVDPGYGKYHIDGHRACNVNLEPDESIKIKDICPVCKKPLTLGVLHRINQLADREEGEKPKDAKPFKRLIPLSEILAAVYNKGVATKTIWEVYNKLMSLGKSELDVVMNSDLNKIEAITSKKVADIVKLNREGKVKIKPGYDGVYGEPKCDIEAALSFASVDDGMIDIDIAKRANLPNIKMRHQCSEFESVS